MQQNATILSYRTTSCSTWRMAVSVSAINIQTVLFRDPWKFLLVSSPWTLVSASPTAPRTQWPASYPCSLVLHIPELVNRVIRCVFLESASLPDHDVFGCICVVGHRSSCLRMARWKPVTRVYHTSCLTYLFVDSCDFPVWATMNTATMNAVESPRGPRLPLF